MVHRPQSEKENILEQEKKPQDMNFTIPLDDSLHLFWFQTFTTKPKSQGPE